MERVIAELRGCRCGADVVLGFALAALLGALQSCDAAVREVMLNWEPSES